MKRVYSVSVDAIFTFTVHAETIKQAEAVGRRLLDQLDPVVLNGNSFKPQFGLPWLSAIDSKNIVVDDDYNEDPE